MAKSKYAPALFEVISGKDDKTSGRLSLPKWWRRGEPAEPASTPTGPSEQAGGPTSSAAASEPSASAAVAPVAADTAATGGAPAQAVPSVAVAVPPRVTVTRPAGAGPSTGTAPSIGMGEPRRPWFRIHEGRVELSLNPTNALIAVGVLAILMFGVFELGRGLKTDGGAMADKSGRDGEFAGLLGSKPDPKVMDVGQAPPPSSSGRNAASGAGSPAGSGSRQRTATPPAGPSAPPTAGAPAQPAGAPAAAVQRTPGMYYLVFEGFKPEDRAQAEQLREWLMSKHQIEATIERAGGERWQLVGTVPYTSANDRKAEEFRKYIIDLGKQYKADLGAKANYDMRAPLFVQARIPGSRGTAPPAKAPAGGQNTGR